MFKSLFLHGLIIASGSVASYGGVYVGDASSTIKGTVIKSPFVLRTKGNRIVGYVRANEVGHRLDVQGSVAKSGKFHARILGKASSGGSLDGTLAGNRLRATGKLRVPGAGTVALKLQSHAVEVAPPGFEGVYYSAHPQVGLFVTLRVYHTDDAQGKNYMMDVKVRRTSPAAAFDKTVSVHQDFSDNMIYSESTDTLSLHVVMRRFDDGASGTLFTTRTILRDFTHFNIDITGGQWAN